MMFARAVLVLSAAACGSAAATTMAVDASAFTSSVSTVTFETGTTMLPIDPEVNFVHSGVSGRWFGMSGNFQGFFGDQGASNLWSGNHSDMAVTFATPQGMAGAWIGNIQNFTNTTVTSVSFRALGSNGEELGVVNVVLPPLGGSVFAGLSSTQGIARLEWLHSNDGFFSIDNLMFQASPVPEPAGGLALSMGLAALLGFGARRKARRPHGVQQG